MRVANHHSNRVKRSSSAFSLIELLVVIAIIILLAGLALPSLRGLTASNITTGATQQLMDDLAEARLQAINSRGTVYMVFVSPNVVRTNWGALNLDQRRQLTNAVKGQYSSYALFTRRSLGDQPGADNPRYLTDWRSLPDGIFIATNKFALGLTTQQWEQWPDLPSTNLMNRPFFHMPIPFPTAKDAPMLLPVVAFDYRGRLLTAPFDRNAPFRRNDEVIPFTKGALILERDALGNPLIAAAEVIETPRGNYADNPRIHIDPLTGRARVVFPEKEKEEGRP